MKQGKTNEPQVLYRHGSYFLKDADIGLEAKLYWPRISDAIELRTKIEQALDEYKSQKLITDFYARAISI